MVAYVFCDEDRVRAREMGEHYIGDYYSACVKHHELGGSHFAEQQGYTYCQQKGQAPDERCGRRVAGRTHGLGIGRRRPLRGVPPRRWNARLGGDRWDRPMTGPWLTKVSRMSSKFDTSVVPLNRAIRLLLERRDAGCVVCSG